MRPTQRLKLNRHNSNESFQKFLASPTPPSHHDTIGRGLRSNAVRGVSASAPPPESAGVANKEMTFNTALSIDVQLVAGMAFLAQSVYPCQSQKFPKNYLKFSVDPLTVFGLTMEVVIMMRQSPPQSDRSSQSSSHRQLLLTCQF